GVPALSQLATLRRPAHAGPVRVLPRGAAGSQAAGFPARLRFVPHAPRAGNHRDGGQHRGRTAALGAVCASADADAESLGGRSAARQGFRLVLAAAWRGPWQLGGSLAHPLGPHAGRCAAGGAVRVARTEAAALAHAGAGRHAAGGAAVTAQWQYDPGAWTGAAGIAVHA